MPPRLRTLLLLLARIAAAAVRTSRFRGCRTSDSSCSDKDEDGASLNVAELLFRRRLSVAVGVDDRGRCS